MRTGDRNVSNDPLGGLVESDWTCPRCGRDCHQHFYGPCEDCRAELRAKFAAQRRDVETVDYEPKMNVTPNAVALKDD